MVDGASPARRRIMLIDADDSYLRMLEEMLHQCNYQVTSCQKVGKAFLLLGARGKTSDYDLILSSASMPEIEGFKLVYIIRSKLQIPVILMSYDEEPNFVLKGMIARGSCGYLKKPIHMDALRNLWHCDYLYGWEFKTRAIEQGEDCRSIWSVPDGKTSDAAGRKCEPEVPVQRKKTFKSTDSIIWTAQLHHSFEEAVNELGIYNAKPKSILRKMSAEGLTVSQVRRHWRLYLKKLKHSLTSEDVYEVLSDGTDVHDSTHCLHGGEASDGGDEWKDPVECKKVKKSYMLWSFELHQQFEKAVKELGGLDKATPKKIFEMLKAEGVTHRQVQSHFQTSRRNRQKKGAQSVMPIP